MRNRLFIFITGLILIGISYPWGRAAIKDDLKFILRNNPVGKPLESPKTTSGPQTKSEFAIVLTGAIRVYQKFVSTQDMNVCNFKPSCSHFANDALAKYGVFYGLLMASDRLQRCNGSNTGYSHKRDDSGKLIDPIDKYYLGEK
jgi:uncharacterized protein